MYFSLSECKPRQNQVRGLVDRELLEAPSNFIAGRRKALFCFGSLVILDVVFRYLSLFLLYINMEISKNRCYMSD